MTPEAQAALTAVNQLTPINIQLKTDASFNTRLDFESMWNRYGPQAARYSILARYLDGSISPV